MLRVNGPLDDSDGDINIKMVKRNTNEAKDNETITLT